MKTYKLIFKNEVREEDFYQLVNQEGWEQEVIDEVVEALEDEDEMLQRQHWAASGQTDIYVVRDEYISLIYLEIENGNAKEVYQKLSTNLKLFYSREEIFAMCEPSANKEKFAHAICHLGVSAPPDYDDDYAKLFTSFLNHNDADIRYATVTAITHPKWPELMGAVEKLAEEDPDPEIRIGAQEYIDFLNGELKERVIEAHFDTTQGLKVIFSDLWMEEGDSFEHLASWDYIYTNLQEFVNGRPLPGIERIAEGKKDIKLIARNLMTWRRLRKPCNYSGEFVELSGFKYEVEYLLKNSKEILLLSVLQNRKPVKGFDKIELDMIQVRNELNIFRDNLQKKLLEKCPEELAIRWWKGSFFENFDDSLNYPDEKK